MKGGPTDPPNRFSAEVPDEIAEASMKGGPTDPPNRQTARRRRHRHPASMKGGPTDPPNELIWRELEAEDRLQ